MDVNIDLFYAVESADVTLVSAALSKLEDRQKIYSALILALSLSTNFVIVKLLLDCGLEKTFVDELFIDFAWQGVRPRATLALQGYISDKLRNDLYRIHHTVRTRGDKSFHFVTFTELERHHEVFQRLLPKRLEKRRLTTHRHRTFSDQSWMNDMFQMEFTNDHRLVLVDLLQLDPSLLRPSSETVADTFQRAVFREQWSIADLLLQSYEGPLTRSSLMINQAQFDAAFEESVECEDLAGLRYLLSKPFIRPQQAAIDRAYQIYANGNMVAHMIRARVGILRRTRRGSTGGFQWQEYYDSIRALLKEHVDPEVVHAAEEADRRRIAREAQLRHLRMAERGIDIHSFSATLMPDMPAGTDYSTVVNAVENMVQDAMDVEDEAKQAEEVEAVAPTGRRSTRHTLTDAINRFLESRVGNNRRDLEHSGIPEAPPLDQVEAQITRLIDREFPDPAQRADAINRLTNGIDTGSQRTLQLAWHYLCMHHPQSIRVWLQGFLGESISEHSCNPGVAERIMTGLRGVGDADLDRIFAQAEGPLLARNFLNFAFNIYTSGGARLADELVTRGVVQSMQDVDNQPMISAALVAYARETVSQYQVNMREFEPLIDVVIESTMDSFDPVLRPELVRRLQQQVQQSRHVTL